MLNKASTDLIKISEGCKLLCYADAVGVATIGYGHTKTLKPADIGKKRITAAEAERLLLVDLAHFEAQVAKLVKVKLTENQRGALVSWTYNLGEGNLAKSTLLKRINAKAPVADIERSWMQWVNAGGKRLQGLVNRRAAEMALYRL
ncbi:lysozyme [Ensifer sp. SL37]|uniref:lysozyme n=1 Tax=Ensifer sp. SL37 TaxID=2995137 RepID=UPI002274C517|nr:lysozyme [Ensifer sp. SL37]MCY1741451.1 lysozyme [Ensifer sp. SL37]